MIFRKKDEGENKRQDNNKEKVKYNKDKEILKVATKSNPKSVAGAIANVFREEGKVELQAIGAGAVNQAVKAIAIARGYVATGGVDLVCIPAFADIEIDGEDMKVKEAHVNNKRYLICYNPYQAERDKETRDAVIKD